MSCCIEFGKCDICGKEDNLIRTYFEYDIKCDCHSPRHFELVVHCKDCIPSMPTEIHPYIKAMDGKSYKTTITNILPIEIVGEFIITEPIIQEQPMIHEEICTYEDALKYVLENLVQVWETL